MVGVDQVNIGHGQLAGATASAQVVRVLLPHNVQTPGCDRDLSPARHIARLVLGVDRDRGRPLLCVAGYLIDSGHTKRLAREWRRILTDYDLPYFRMSACAHGNHPFHNLTLDQRIEVGKRAISCIKAHTIMGLAVSLDTAEFQKLAPDHHLIGSPYTFCVHCVIGGVERWAQETEFNGKIAYFFEAGHRSQSEAHAIMGKMFQQPDLRNASRYSSHSFVQKNDSAAVQAADLLAWQWYTDRRHEIEGRPRRKDISDLLEHPHWTLHVGPDKLELLAATWDNELSPEEALVRLQLGDRP